MARDQSADPLRTRFTLSFVVVIVVSVVGLIIFGLIVFFSVSVLFK